MPKSLLSRQNILLLLILIAVAVGGYIWYSQSAPAERQVGVVSVDSSAVGSDLADKGFLKLLDNLETLRLDRSIFQEPSFQTLVDLVPQTAPREAKGRTNPFRPF